VRSLPSLQNALYDIVRSVAEVRDDVVVRCILAPARAFEVKVSAEDYELILSSLHLIKRLASGLAGMPEGKEFGINLVVNDKDQFKIANPT
jgi:FKBP-type peptidyl-prolyl cis-trans isomerase (trigger factor)